MEQWPDKGLDKGVTRISTLAKLLVSLPCAPSLPSSPPLLCNCIPLQGMNECVQLRLN